MKNDTITISVPERYKTMSERTLKRCIGRRLQRPQPAKKSWWLGVTALFTLTVIVSFTLVYASSQEKGKEDNASTPIQVNLIQVGERDLWEVSEEEKALLIRTVLASARGEGRLAMQAVAQAIRTICEQQNLTVAEAITEYRWSSTIRGEVADEILAMADDAVTNIIRGFYAVDTEIKYACNPNVQDCSWHEENCEFVVQIGALRFYN